MTEPLSTPAAAPRSDAPSRRGLTLTHGEAHLVIEKLRRRLRAAVVGRDATIDLVIVALLADGHVLLEDFPGSGKTTLARALGEGIRAGGGRSGGVPIAPFRRIQFTPDLLPSDITGTNVFEAAESRFVFRRGPLFAHVVLADEINRTSPKVQAAMLEAMAEKQVTIDEQSHALDPLFCVIATQNPLDVAGTYPLPTPQLDRFLFKIVMSPIDRDAELAVLAQYPETSLEKATATEQVDRDELLAVRALVRNEVAVAPKIREALVELARTLRADPRVVAGPSTRSLVVLLPALGARALLEGRDFVGPDDIAALAPFVFGHRIECAPGTDDPGAVIAEHVGKVVDAIAKETLRR